MTLIAFGSIILATQLLGAAQDRSVPPTVTTTRLDDLRRAIELYNLRNGRLPCPAKGDSDDGIEVAGGAGACAYPNGTVPWKSLGVKQDQALDGWNRKISYRVFSGASGMTVNADMTACEADTTQPSNPLEPATMTCPTSAPRALAADYLSARAGLTVNEYGAPTSGVAFVLICHGQTGAGAWLPGGQQVAPPNPANAQEMANVGSSGPFVIAEQSDESVLPDATNHFDDQVVYRLILDVIEVAGRGPRGWAVVEAPSPTE